MLNIILLCSSVADQFVKQDLSRLENYQLAILFDSNYFFVKKLQ